MNISKHILRPVAMLGMALASSFALATGTNDVVSGYAEPFTNSVFIGGYAITNANGWSAGSDDKSSISNLLIDGYSGSFPITNYTHDAGNYVLQLNTEGTTLTNSLSNASFASSKMYVDTMVKFVASDSMPITVSNDVNVKAAAFVNMNSNLVVYCGGFNVGSDFAPTKFVTTTNLVIPGNWYRLTIALDAYVSDPDFAQAFKVQINGQDVWSDQAYTDNWKSEYKTITAPGGTWFLTAANWPGGGIGANPTELSALAFQGTGFIDDLVVSAQVPNFGPLSETWFTITQNLTGSGSANPAGNIQIKLNASTQIVYTAAQYFEINTLATNSTLVAAAAGKLVYTQDMVNVQGHITNDIDFVRPTRHIVQTINGGTHGSGDNGTGDILVLNGANTSVTYTVNSDWYTASASAGTYCTATNGNGTAAASLTFTEVLANTTAEATFSPKADGSVVTGVPTQYGLDNGVTAAWAVLNPVAMQTGYMLNLYPTTNATMDISVIGVNGSSLSVTVKLNTNSVPVNTTINGTLWVYDTTNLVVGFTSAYKATLQYASFTNSGTHVFTFTDASSNKFYKAGITQP